MEFTSRSTWLETSKGDRDHGVESFREVYTDQNLAGIWLEAGAAIAMIITSTVFLPRYMALGLAKKRGVEGGG